MIEWAMLFALGAFASGLVGLALGAIVVRRTRRVTERRLRAALAVRRAEFAAEHDQERVRFAVEMRRLEREAAKLRDQATAHRLDADIKEQELFNLRADLGDRELEVQDLSERLTEAQGALFDTERSLAETSAALKTTRHGWEAEVRRRTAVDQALRETAALADERRLEIIALRAENEDLRSSLQRLRLRLAELGDLRWATRPFAHPQPALPPAGPEAAAEEGGGRVVPLRPLPPPEAVDVPAAETAQFSPETESIERIAAEIHRIAGEAEAELERVWRVPQVTALTPGQRPPSGSSRHTAAGNGKEASVAAPVGGDSDVVPLRPTAQDNETAEARFLEALEEIRSLRRAGGVNPGE